MLSTHNIVRGSGASVRLGGEFSWRLIFASLNIQKAIYAGTVDCNCKLKEGLYELASKYTAVVVHKANL